MLWWPVKHEFPRFKTGIFCQNKSHRIMFFCLYCFFQVLLEKSCLESRLESQLESLAESERLRSEAEERVQRAEQKCEIMEERWEDFCSEFWSCSSTAHVVVQGSILVLAKPYRVCSTEGGLDSLRTIAPKNLAGSQEESSPWAKVVLHTLYLEVSLIYGRPRASFFCSRFPKSPFVS